MVQVLQDIEQKLVRTLANEELNALHGVIRKQIDSGVEKVLALVYMAEKMKVVEMTGVNFTSKEIGPLGLDNCCKYFETITRLYQEHTEKRLEDPNKENIWVYGSYENRVGSYYVDDFLNTKIEIPGITREIETAINEYYKILSKEDCMGGINTPESIYNYALYTIFTTIYDHIRDYIEGATYFPGFGTQRILDASYKESSERLIGDVSTRYGISSEEAKEKMRKILQNGLENLRKIPKEYYELMAGKMEEQKSIEPHI